MGTKRYVTMVAALVFSVLLDAFIFVGILDTPWSRVPTFFHLANIVVLSFAVAILFDMIFKADLFR